MYTSLPELRGRRVVHWIDNTSAIAALVKGYSAAPDSRCMVHAHAATVAALAVSVWFLYVPSAANLADLPSRHDYALLTELGSRRVAVVWPEFARWDQPASAWVAAVAR